MSTPETFVTVTIYRAERLRNSANGNPRWELHTDAGTFLTLPDAQLGHGIANLTNARLASYALDKPVRLVFTGQGGVSYIRDERGRSFSDYQWFVIGTRNLIPIAGGFDHLSQAESARERCAAHIDISTTDIVAAHPSEFAR